MPLALLIAAAWPTLVMLPPNAHPLQPLCRGPAPTLIADAKAAQVHPLVDEPPARQIKAVLNITADGCVTPIVVRAEVGQPRR